MKFISWNVNGLRACYNKGFADFFEFIDADIFAVQETKMQEGQLDIQFPGYQAFFNSAVKKGYSGTAIFTKTTPISACYGIGCEEHDQEGRVITLEYDSFYFVNVYTPNSQRELLRLEYRMKWEDAFRSYLSALDKEKPVIVCGDLNVAHKEIDLKNPKTNTLNAGFTVEERGKFSELLDAGFTDSFRYLYPDRTGAYTWWSYMYNARTNNAGWRIDYFLVSDKIKKHIKESEIYFEVMGSDHCPIGIQII
ncbi:MAG: exodeoxyribonuclease III [Clostridiales bacterium]|nr:exodeoxyribonuclease III [Clostridiales bacterium]